MELVTGRKGVAHITSQQDRMKHQGTWGDGAYILKTGQMLAPQVQSSNEIRIRDGALMVQGALGCVKVNTYDPVTIQNGTQGMKRIDLICWQYTYDAEQDVESAEWIVIQGTPAETDPQQPAYTDGDIQQGDSPVQVPVFAVELDGINVTGVTTLLPTAPTFEELNSKMSDQVILWQGAGHFMNESQVVNLSENISDQKNGIMLIWSRYKDTPQNYGWCVNTIPKTLVGLFPGAGHDVVVGNTGDQLIASKYIYISDGQITGNSNNNVGITRNWVLRYVVGY